MKNKILFVVDWPEQVENLAELQARLDNYHSEKYEWKVWSCKKRIYNGLVYRWYCYAKGVFFIIKNRKKYDGLFIWQQMIGYLLFEILSIIKLRIPDSIMYTYIYSSKWLSRNQKKHIVYNALKHSKALIWASSDMADGVNQKFKKFRHKNFTHPNPIFEKIDPTLPVDSELDDPYFRNGIYTAGKSGRDFNIVIRAFKNTNIPVTIVCPDNYPITESNITSNIRILPYSRVNHEQYYALASQAFCILISLDNEKSPCGQLLINFAMENSLPIIATDSDGVTGYVENNVNGLLFKIGQIDEIRNSYEKLKKDESFRNNIIKNAKITAREMHPDNFIKKIKSIFESDISNSKILS